MIRIGRCPNWSALSSHLLEITKLLGIVRVEDLIKAIIRSLIFKWIPIGSWREVQTSHAPVRT
jgi:hypothetical protein